jgi:hypothetical protein
VRCPKHPAILRGPDVAAIATIDHVALCDGQLQFCQQPIFNCERRVGAIRACGRYAPAECVRLVPPVPCRRKEPACPSPYHRQRLKGIARHRKKAPRLHNGALLRPKHNMTFSHVASGDTSRARLTICKRVIDWSELKFTLGGFTPASLSPERPTCLRR